ncbi:membrane-associated protein, putative [Bodo saltans]|uniref:Membrane-associated protein, putative n=1 Tax=Bodo saltans TaxID=75058 RepID=A0A0S4JEX3_BODSA|nr:membrane-associated protein, putative [Bodo saltans]|eukprot:CUG89005.1 membrane-associated protein, putative [Bodo saltans]
MFRWDLLFVLLVVMHITCNGQLSASAAELVAQDIQCDDASSSSTPLTLNAMNATNRHFRLMNCTRRIAVSVLCGIDADHPLMVEVVGGTTLPLFTLSGRKEANGESIFSDVILVVRNVLMALLPGNQFVLDGQSSSRSTSFDVENALSPVVFHCVGYQFYRVSIIVEHSQLQWISTNTSKTPFQNTLLFGVTTFNTSGITNVSVIIRNSSMFVWSNTSLVSLVALVSPLGGNLSVVMTEQSELHVVHHPAVLVSLDSVVVHFQCESSCAFLNVTVSDSIVVLDSTGIAIVFAEFYSSVEVATVVDSHITVHDTNFTLKSHITCFITSVSDVVVRRGVSMSLWRVQFSGVLDMSSLAALLLTAKNPSLFVTRITSTTADGLAIHMESVTLAAMKNLSHDIQKLLSTSTVFQFSSGGGIGLLCLAGAVVTNAAIFIQNSRAHTQEQGSYILARNELLSAVPIGVLGVFNLIVYVTDGSLQNVTIDIHNCTQSSEGEEDGTTTNLVCTPSVLSGTVMMSTGVLGVYSTCSNLSVAVTDCNVTATGNIPTAPSAINMWNTVGIFLHSAVGNYIVTDIPDASLLLPEAQRSVQMNHSSVVVERCTTTRTSLVSDFSAAGKLQLSACLISASNIFNTSVTLTDSTLNVDNGVTTNGAASPLSVVPISTLVHFAAHLDRVNASTSTALMAVSGAVSLRIATLVVSRSRIGRSAGSSSPQSTSVQQLWDAVSLPPFRTGYASTLSLTNITINLSDNTLYSLRSVLGNVTTIKGTGVYTDGPLRIAVPNCTSNTWDGEPLMYTDAIRAVDGQSFPNFSLVSMTAENGETWCTQTTVTHSLEESRSTRLKDTNGPTAALVASVAASRVSTVVATSIVLAVLLSNSPVSAASSAFPRLQGLVGSLRLSARCTQSLSGDNDNDSSGYPVSEVSDNPLLLQLPSSATQLSISYAAGALLGNSALVIVVSVVSHGFHKVQWYLAVKRRNMLMPMEKKTQAHNDVSFLTGVFTVCLSFLPTTPLPSSLLLFQGLLLEPTVNAAIVSVASGHRGVLSVILGLVIGLGWIALPFAFLWLLCIRHAPLPVVTVAVRRIPNVRLRFEHVGRALEWLCAEQEEWITAGRSRVAREAAQNVMAQLGPTFRGFRGGRHWYFIVDAALAVLTGVFVGAAESVESADACDAAVWGTACVGAVALASFVLIGGLRPFVVRFELFVSLCVSLLAVIAGALLLANAVEASGVVSLLASVFGLLPPIAALMWTVCLREKNPYLNFSATGIWDNDVDLDRRTKKRLETTSVKTNSERERKLNRTFSSSGCGISLASHEGTDHREEEEVARRLTRQQESLVALVECICTRQKTVFTSRTALLSNQNRCESREQYSEISFLFCFAPLGACRPDKPVPSRDRRGVRHRQKKRRRRRRFHRKFTSLKEFPARTPHTLVEAPFFSEKEKRFQTTGHAHSAFPPSHFVCDLETFDQRRKRYDLNGHR